MNNNLPNRRDLMLAIGGVAFAGAFNDVRAQSISTVLANGLAFPEGPVLLKDGSVVVVEILGDKLTRFATDGSISKLADIGPGPNGLGLGPDGKLYVLTNGGRPGNTNGGSVKRLNIVTGAIETLYTEFNSEKLKGPNDVVFDEWGDFWFSDFAGSAVYNARTDGKTLTLVAKLEGANGIALAPDRRTLYVVQAREKKIASFAIKARGQLVQEAGVAKVTTLAILADGLDSMKVEASGNLLIASGEAGITTVSPQGKIIDKTPINGLRVTNLVFAGKDLRTLYVTGNERGSSTGQVVSLPWSRVGLKLLYS
jgi:gluconolactonase